MYLYFVLTLPQLLHVRPCKAARYSDNAVSQKIVRDLLSEDKDIFCLILTVTKKSINKTVVFTNT